MMKVAVVEDDQITGRLLVDTLAGAGMRVELFATGADALEKIGSYFMPDVALMDINLPDISGIELTELLKQRHPAIEIIVQTVMEDTTTIMNAIKAGATGYLLKASQSHELLEAIRVVREGGSFLTSRIARKMLQEFRTLHGREGDEMKFGLTERENEILTELVNGASYKEIATKLSISYHTVNNHVRRIYEKMQVNSRGEAVAKILSKKKKNSNNI